MDLEDPSATYLQSNKPSPYFWLRAARALGICSWICCLAAFATIVYAFIWEVGGCSVKKSAWFALVRSGYPKTINFGGQTWEGGEVLGSGLNGEVFSLTKNGDDSSKYVLKYSKLSGDGLLATEAKFHKLAWARAEDIVTAFVGYGTVQVNSCMHDFIIMEKFGASLEKLIDKQSKGHLWVFQQVPTIVDTLQKFHEETGLVHADYSFANILAVDDGDNVQLKVTDFGNAQKVGTRSVSPICVGNGVESKITPFYDLELFGWSLLQYLTNDAYDACFFQKSVYFVVRMLSYLFEQAPFTSSVYLETKRIFATGCAKQSARKQVVRKMDLIKEHLTADRSLAREEICKQRKELESLLSPGLDRPECPDLRSGYPKTIRFGGKIWERGEVLGSGFWGQVFALTKRGDDSSKYVLKSSIRPGDGLLATEAKIHKLAWRRAEDIVSTFVGYGTIQANGCTHDFIIMEKFGTALEKFLVKESKGHLWVFQQVPTLVDMMQKFHEETDLIHADYRFANILAVADGGNVQLKLTDFGNTQKIGTKAPDKIWPISPMGVVKGVGTKFTPFYDLEMFGWSLFQYQNNPAYYDACFFQKAVYFMVRMLSYFSEQAPFTSNVYLETKRIFATGCAKQSPRVVRKMDIIKKRLTADWNLAKEEIFEQRLEFDSLLSPGFEMPGQFIG